MDNLPTGGTDYFTRIREGESNMEWVQIVGELTVTNKVAGSNEVFTVLTPDGTVPRMTLVGDHSWRYHYEIPTNAIGGKLSFYLKAKEHYTNETDAATWLTRVNDLYTVEQNISDIPFTATLHSPGDLGVGNNLTNISVILDDSSTHLKIEYNDEQRAFSLSHASYQQFNLWTDARSGFRGNVMDGNGVSNSGVSDSKKRYDAPFNSTWESCPQESTLWIEKINPDETAGSGAYPVNKWFSVHKTPNAWTLHNGRFVLGARSDTSNNLAVELDGLGEGALALENLSASKLPLGLGTVNFTARIAQPIEYEDFATYMDGLSCTNYAISAKVTMSRQKENIATQVFPNDMSPVHPSVSFVGYHRGKHGCYEFRMTRSSDSALTLAFYKWTRSGSSTKPTLLTSKVYTSTSTEPNLLVPKSDDDVRYDRRTSAYFLVYTLPGGKVKLEGHLSSERTQPGNGVTGSEAGLSTSAISYVDETPGVLAQGGSYGVGSIDCRAGFGKIKIHDVTAMASDGSTDGRISSPGEFVGINRLENEWDYYTSRWEVDSQVYDANGAISAVVPSNQVIEVWVADASSGEDTSEDESGWINTGYSVVVNSFTTNMFSVAPHRPGSWNVRLQTGEEEAAGVVLDDVSLTPWEGVERWLGNGNTRNGSVNEFSRDWVYTKGWISTAATITHDGRSYELPDANVISVDAGYAYVFNRPGNYRLTAKTDIEIDRVLLVGGGGAGGAAMGGGGGGGGVVEHNWSNDPAVLKEGKSITITVGAGGTVQIPSGTGSNATTQPAGNSGGNSSVSGITGKSVTTAKGGGGGGGWGQGARSSGTGGGGAHSNNGAAGTSGQGYAGGKSGDGTGGGGGGAGKAGADATPSPSVVGNEGKGGDGGAGKASDITGRVVYYGGGGGGGAGWQPTQTPGFGGVGGGGDGARYRVAYGAAAGEDGLGGGGGGGTYMGANNTDAVNKQGQGARGGCGTVILRVRTKSRLCVLQPSRGKVGYPMGLRTPYIDKGMSLFSYSYENADSNCVMLVQIATNMAPADLTSYVPRLTESLATSGTSKAVWTTIARHEFKNLKPDELASGTRTAFISLRQHWIDDMHEGRVYTNVCGVIRVIVDPDVVSRVVNASPNEVRDAMVDYGKITLTKAYCYDEPSLNLRSWFGFNVHTEGWDGSGTAGRFAYLTDWPDGLSIALNFSATPNDNRDADALGIGLGETDPTEVQNYAQQNPFVQCAALTNGIGTVSFRARLFDTSKDAAVITLYGGTDPAQDQVTTESQIWKPLTNFVVTSSTYQPFEWSRKSAKNDYKAIRLEAAGARWGRYPAGQAAAWEWDDLTDATKYGASVQQPINRVFIDEVSVSEAIVPRLKFLDVRPFREHLGTEENRVIEDINSMNQQPLIAESWGIQCRVEPQQMSDELDTDSIRVWMEVYRGEEPWGYENWKDAPKYKMVGGQEIQQRFTGELVRVPGAGLVFRSYYTSPESIMPPEEKANTVYQYVVRAEFRDKTGATMDPAVLEAVDWKSPDWYRGSSVGAANASGDPSQFSAYTILDAISPRRAWINEVNICDAEDTRGRYQFLEFAVPENADLKGWQVKYTAYNLKSGNLFTFGIDDGVSDLTSKIGKRHGVDSTNHYTFVSVCAPSAKDNVQSDGYWKGVSQPLLTDGVFRYYQPYGIQLVRPSGIIEHEIVVQGTNTSVGTFYEYESSGTNLLARLRKADLSSQWFYAGEDLPTINTTLGVFKSHGEDPDCWTNYMWDTSMEINKLKDGTLQEIPKGYFLEPFGTNVWIYSTLLRPDLMKQFYGGRDMGANAVIVLPKGTPTNIVLSVTNWYQVGKCTINDVDVPGARGQTGTYRLDLGTVTNTLTVLIDAEPDDRLKNKWGLTDQNAYSPAVLNWLFAEYSGYDPDDLSAAIYRDLSGSLNTPLTLTEMYWLNIPPVHQAPVSGGSNIWFVAGMGSQVAGSEPDVEPYLIRMGDGSFRTNVAMTVTMMITNTVTGVATPPDRLNGLAYDGEGSAGWSGSGQPSWTSAVFIVTGALQKPGVSDSYLPLHQYTFKPGSFGLQDDPQHPFQTRVMVTDPYSSNSMGDYYGWGKYRNIYNVFYRWVIKPRPEEYRVSPVPLTPNWTPSDEP